MAGTEGPLVSHRRKSPVCKNAPLRGCKACRAGQGSSSTGDRPWDSQVCLQRQIMIFPSRRQVAVMFAMGPWAGTGRKGRVVAEKCPRQDVGQTKTNPLA